MKDGEIAGAFSVSMPKYRLTEENKRRLIKPFWQQKRRLKRIIVEKERQTKVDWDFVCLSFYFVKRLHFLFICIMKL